MTENHKPVLLLPEATDPTVAEIRNDPKLHQLEEQLGVQVQFGHDGEAMDLSEAAAQLNQGSVDIVVAGAAHGSPDVIRTAILDINRQSSDRDDHRRLVHSFFVMEKDGTEPIIFTDCAVNAKPSPDQLAQIAHETADSFTALFPDREPVVAFLSLSTFGSANTEDVLSVRQAYDTFVEQWPDTKAYGEIQADAALDPKIFEKKAAKAGVAFDPQRLPNIFVFPDGQSGNIAYKLVEQLAGYVAVGPMLNGIAKNWHDLSRGVSKDALLRSIFYSVLLYRARGEQAPEADK